jgi:hypothetical protein
MAIPRICSIDGCGKKHQAKGLCHGHYTKQRINSKPELTHASLLEMLRYDSETGVFTWLVNTSNVACGSEAGCVYTTQDGRTYRNIRIRKLYLAHRLAFFYVTAQWPAQMVDHRDGDGLNNRWDNLRLADGSQNQANRGAGKNNRVGLKGVKRANQKSGFTASIAHRGKSIHLGTFKTAQDAHTAYSRAAIDLNGVFARTK